MEANPAFARRLLLFGLAGLLLLAVAAPTALAQVVEARIGMGRVSDVNFNHDGSRYVVSHERTVDVFETATGSRVLRLPRHPSRVQSADFSPEGDRIATTTQHGTARVFDATIGALLLKIPGWGWLREARFGPDGETLLVAGWPEERNGTTVLYDARTGRRLVTYASRQGSDAAQISPDGTRVIAVSRDHRLILYDATSGSQIRVLAEGDETNWVWAIAFSPDSARAAVNIDDEARVYDLATGTVDLVLGHDDAVRGVDWSADGTRILTGSVDRTARLWDASTGAEVLRLEAAGSVRVVAISPDGTTALGACEEEGSRIRRWDLSSGALLDTHEGHASGGVWSAAWSPDETRILTCGSEDARLWDVATGDLVTGVRLEGPGRLRATRVAFLPEGPRLVSWEEDRVTIRDVVTGDMIAAFPGHTDVLLDAVFTSDGTRLLTASADGTAILWDVAAQTPLRTLTGHTDAILTVAVSPDGTRVATGSSDETVRIWDPATGEALHVLDAPRERVNDVAFSPDGKKLIAGSGDGRARIWKVKTGEFLRTLDHGDTVRSVCFSANGRLAATGGTYPVHVDPIPESLAKIWDVDTGERLETLAGHFGGVLAVAFSADGERLLTAGIDAHTVIWDWRDDAPSVKDGPATSDEDLLPGEEVRWTVDVGDAEGDPIDVIWSFGDGATASGPSVRHAWSHDGVYRVNVTASSGPTKVTKTMKVVIGDGDAPEPRVKLRLDLRRDGRDKLDLRVEGPFDLPPGIQRLPEIQVDVVSVQDGVELNTGLIELTLDEDGKAKADGVKAKLRPVTGTDLWRLKLKLKRRSFDVDRTDEAAWNDGNATVPVTVCVRAYGQVVWQASADFRYLVKEKRRGVIRK